MTSFQPTAAILGTAILLCFTSSDIAAQLPPHQWSFGVGAPSNGSGMRDMEMMPSGDALVLLNFSVEAMDVDPGPGVVIVDVFVSALNYRGVVVRYDHAGLFVQAYWLSQLANIGASEVCSDPWGNVIIKGVFVGEDIDFDPGPGTVLLSSGGQSLCFMAKFDANGELLWALPFDQSMWGEEVGEMVTDHEGNIFFTVSLGVAACDVDPGPGVHLLQSHGSKALVKLTADGDFAWDIVLERKAIYGAGMEVNKMLPLPNGDLVIAMSPGRPTDFDPGPDSLIFSPQPLGGPHPVLARYDTQGNLVWAMLYGDDDNSGEAQDLSMDDNGVLYAMGRGGGAFDLDPGPGIVPIPAAPYDQCNIFVIRLDLDGNYLGGFNITGDICGDRGAFGDAFPAGGMVLCAELWPGSVDVDPSPNDVFLTSQTLTCFCATYTANDELIGVSKFDADPAGRVNHLAISGDRVIIGGVYAEHFDAEPGPPLIPLATGPYSSNQAMVLSYWDPLSAVQEQIVDDGSSISIQLAGDVLRIGSSEQELSHLFLLDAAGRTVLQQRLNGLSASIDLGMLPSAAYAARVLTADGRSTSRTVVLAGE